MTGVCVEANSLSHEILRRLLNARLRVERPNYQVRVIVSHFHARTAALNVSTCNSGRRMQISDTVGLALNGL